MVGIESSKWGDYRGIIQNENALSVSHGDMVGLTHFLGNTKFDAKHFFLDMVHELKEKGY
jgi:triacylglycerol lipase